MPEDLSLRVSVGVEKCFVGEDESVVQIRNADQVRRAFDGMRYELDTLLIANALGVTALHFGQLSASLPIRIFGAARLIRPTSAEFDGAAGLPLV